MVYATILAGGIGTRFWPFSTPQKPKQLISLFNSRSMIELTVDRIRPLIDISSQRIVTIPEQASLIASQIKAFTPSNFIIEPFPKNTAPCIGLAAVHLLKDDHDPIMVVLPADHLIHDEESFRHCLKIGIDFVQETDGIVTVGIEPSRPETGYGYIQYERDEVRKNLHRVRTFAEKPNLETAKRFIETREFLWNSGVFIWSARRILSEIEEFLPKMYVALMEIQDALGSVDEEDRVRRAYQSIKPISIDYGVMEQSRHVYVVKGSFDWSDVGSWEEVYRLTAKNGENNSIRGPVIVHGTRNSYLHSDGQKPIAVVGLENVIVVSTENGILICNRNHVQDVRLAAEQVFKLNG